MAYGGRDMSNMTEHEFDHLASAGFNRIPLIATALADLETPISLYYKLVQSERNGVNSFLVESVIDGQCYSRYAFIGLPARTILRARYIDGVVAGEVVRDREVIEACNGDLLAFAARFQARLQYAKHPSFSLPCVSLSGYFAPSEMNIRSQGRVSRVCGDQPVLPDMQLLLTEELAILDRLAGKLYLVIYVDPAEPGAYARGASRLRELQSRLHGREHLPPGAEHPRIRSYDVGFQRHYIRAVNDAREEISAGKRGSMQLTQNVSTSHRSDPLALYRALRSQTPATRMYLFRFDDLSLIGASHDAATVSGIEVIDEPVLAASESHRHCVDAPPPARRNYGATLRGLQT